MRNLGNRHHRQAHDGGSRPRARDARLDVEQQFVDLHAVEELELIEEPVNDCRGAERAGGIVDQDGATVERIEADVDPRNDASRRLLERLGDPAPFDDPDALQLIVEVMAEAAGAYRAALADRIEDAEPDPAGCFLERGREHSVDDLAWHGLKREPRQI